MNDLDSAVFKSVFDESVNPLAIIDPSESILYVNDAFAGQFRKPQKELVGSGFRALFPDEQTFFDNGIYTGAYQRLWAMVNSFFADSDESTIQFNAISICCDDTTFASRVVIRRIGDGSTMLLNIFDVSEEQAREQNARNEIYRSITHLAEARDNETGQHLRRIGTYSRIIASNLELPAAFVSDIEEFSLFHDIGKVAIPDAVLRAPRKLTDDEYDLMKTHTSFGYEILSDATTLQMAAEIAHCHHEKYDGSGYPRGLSGGAIPISARIVSVADVYDALRSERPYKRAWSHEECVTELRRGEGSHFCPLALEASLQSESQVARLSEELAS